MLTKCAAVKPLRGKKTKTVLNSFIERVNESKRKSNELWVGQGKQFNNIVLQKWLELIFKLMYNEAIATDNGTKSVVAERFIGTLTASDSRLYLGSLNKLVDGYTKSGSKNICY